MERFTVIEGRRVDLCVTQEEYFPFFLRWINDIGTSTLIGRVPPYDIVGEKKWLDGYRNSSNKVFTIFPHSRAKKEPLGVISLDSVDMLNRTAEIGIVVSPKSRNGLVGPEAFNLIVQYGFDVLNLHRLTGKHYDFNGRVGNLGRRLGFKEVGRLRQAHFAGGKYHDIVVYDLLENEYRENLKKRGIEGVIGKIVSDMERRNTK